MRRSTRSSNKRAQLPPDSSDEDEPTKTKSKRNSNKNPKNNKIYQAENPKNENDTETETNETQKTNQEENTDSSSSESDIENYLQPVDELDLDSAFFKITKTTETKSFEDIENNIFSGINKLSDSESENEFEESESNNLPKTQTKETKLDDSKPTTSKLNFQQLHDYTQKIEEAKKLVEKYEAKKRLKQAKHTKNRKSGENINISDLLALGETKSDTLQQDFDSNSESEKEDWEEVEHHDITDINESIIPKDGVQITLELPGGAVHKKKKGIDLVACMKRQLNKIKKENQVYVHKVHLLCWLAHGNYINKVLNDESLLGLALSLIPSQHCYPSARTDLSYLEQVVKWYKNTMPNINKIISKKMSLEKALKIQITRKQAYNKKMLVYIFICILRSLGIQCRLVISFQVAPLRPPASELHSLSTKSEDKSMKASNSKQSSTLKVNKEPKELNSKKVNLGNLNQSKSEKKKNSKDGETKTETEKIDEKNKSDREKTEAKQLDRKEKNSRSKSDSNLKQKRNDSEASSSNRKTSSDTKLSEQKSHKVKSKPGMVQSNKSKTKQPNDSSIKLKIPQVDGADDSDNKPTTSRKNTKPNLKKLSQEESNPCLIKKHPKKLKSLPKMNSDEDSKVCNLKTSPNINIQSNSKTNLKKLNTKPAEASSTKHSPIGSSKKSQTNKLSTSSTNLKKLQQKSNSNKIHKVSEPLNRNRSQYFSQNLPIGRGDIRNDIISIMKGRMVQEREVERSKLVKTRKVRNESDYDSDYAPEPVKKKHHDSDDDEFYETNKVKVKQRVKVKKDEDEEELKFKKGVDVWIEVYLEAEEKWISADVVKGHVHCIKELYSKASHPITYILAWNNDNSIKDITQRYCPNWNTVTRKLRIDKKWWGDSLKPFEGRKTARDREEDEELARLQLDQPLPTAISEYKNHPLYVIKRHLLKFEALYPPDPITLGFIKGEAVYSRDCVHTLHSREVWIKYAKVVKPQEEPYKIVKARAKYDKLSGQVITDKPLELFGKWQVGDYVPPIAENGVVPRNAYGNVELFKACMLPKGTVHLQLPGLNKLARRMNIDCAPAVVGFDFHTGGSHPTFDGYVVCEEYSEVLIAAWYMEQDEQEKRIKEKTEKRIYGNWRKLIKGLLIRERLKARYDFGGPSQTGSGSKKRQSKEPKLLSKKRRLYSESESD